MTTDALIERLRAACRELCDSCEHGAPQYHKQLGIWGHAISRTLPTMCSCKASPVWDIIADLEREAAREKTP